MRTRKRIIVKDFDKLRAAIRSQIRKRTIARGQNTQTLDMEELEAAALCWVIVELQRDTLPPIAIWRAALNAIAGRTCWNPCKGGQDIRQANYRQLTEGRTYRMARANAAAAH
jgi:hypothetical protein